MDTPHDRQTALRELARMIATSATCWPCIEQAGHSYDPAAGGLARLTWHGRTYLVTVTEDGPGDQT